MYLEERNHRDDLNHKMMILFLPITKKNVTSESLYYILFIILLLPLFYYYLIKVVMYLRLDLAVKINVSDQNSKSSSVLIF